MTDEPDKIGQDEIQELLRQSQGASAEAPSQAEGLSLGAADSSGAQTSASGVAEADIELFLRQAEEAIASATQPASSHHPHVRPFELPQLGGAPASSEQASLELLRDVELDVKIELGRTYLSLEEVLSLRKGSVVTLDKLAGDPVDIYVNGRLIARGEVLVLNENFCVRIAELIAGDEAAA